MTGREAEANPSGQFGKVRAAIVLELGKYFPVHVITRGAAWPFAAQVALLGLVHTGDCSVVHTSAGTIARRVLRTRPAAMAVARYSGAAMIAVGALALAERLLA